MLKWLITNVSVSVSGRVQTQCGFFSRGWMDGVLFGRVEVKCGEVVFISLL